MGWLSGILAKCIGLCSVLGGVFGFLYAGINGTIDGGLLGTVFGSGLATISIFSLATVGLTNQYLASSRPRSSRTKRKTRSQAYRERRFFLFF